MFVKVCGLKTKEHIDQAIEYGYDAIGVVTYPKSKRYCPPQLAIELARYAGNRIKRFVVGIRFSDVEAAAPAFDYTQIYEQRQVPNLVLASKEPLAPPAPTIVWISSMKRITSRFFSSSFMMAFILSSN